jgi:hypothetical protein
MLKKPCSHGFTGERVQSVDRVYQVDPAVSRFGREQALGASTAPSSIRAIHYSSEVT